MEKNKKIHVSEEVANFIKSYNAMSKYNQKTNKRITTYWNECTYVETDEENVFEVIFPNNVLSELLDWRLEKITNNETQDNTK